MFGLAEGAMFAGGWFAARAFAPLVAALDHWIALVVLTAVGAKMIREGLRPNDEDRSDAEAPPRRATLIGSIATAIGTSVDSAAVGVAMALAGAPAWTAFAVGATSFVVSTSGYALGPRVNDHLGERAEIVGGGVLILIGASIFVSHVTAG